MNRDRGPLRSHALTAALVLIIFGGILLDVAVPAYGQAVASGAAWLTLLLLFLTRTAQNRSELFFCLAIATIGEVFLGFMWKLYDYRLHNLPLFIPPGHAVVYAAGRRISTAMPAWLPLTLAATMLPVAIAGILLRSDTQAALWFAVLVICMIAARERVFLATMFLFALAIETYGTRLGAWQYVAREPWFGLTTRTSPPLWAGTFYCVLDLIVTRLSNFSRSRISRLRNAARFYSFKKERLMASAASLADKAAASTQPASKPFFVQSPAK